MSTNNTTKKPKSPPYMRRRVQDVFSHRYLDDEARREIAEALFVGSRDSAKRKEVLDQIDELIHLYSTIEERKRCHPSPQVQHQSISELQSAIERLQNPGDTETRRHLFLALGKSPDTVDGFARYKKGIKRLGRWLREIEEACKSAASRIPRQKRGPNQNIPLTWLVDDLAEIWEATNKNIPFGSSKRVDRNKPGIRDSQRPRVFVETVLSHAHAKCDDNTLQNLLKKARHNRQERTRSDDSEASDQTYGM